MDLFQLYKPKILPLGRSRLTPSWINATRQEDYRVEVVDTDEKSTGGIDADTPDMLMLDVSLTEKGGYALCKRLKRKALPRELPVVFILEDKDCHDEALSIELGAIDHFYTPISNRNFQARLRAHFAIANATETLLANNVFLDLHKPGRYEPHEFEIMKTHPALGRDPLKKAYSETGQLMHLIEVEIDLVYSHHKKWDGSSYPQGLAGDFIFIPARLMALADIYDALISARVYKSGMSHERPQDITAGQFADNQSDLQTKTNLLKAAL